MAWARLPAIPGQLPDERARPHFADGYTLLHTLSPVPAAWARPPAIPGQLPDGRARTHFADS